MICSSCTATASTCNTSWRSTNARGRLSGKPIGRARKHPAPDQRKSYSTPLVIDVAGKKQIVSVGADRIYGYDVATGIELWFIEFEGFSHVPRPLFAEGLVIFDPGYMKPQLWAIKPPGAGDLTKTGVVWRAKTQVPANPSPVIVGQNVYMVGDQGVATCLDVATGKGVTNRGSEETSRLARWRAPSTSISFPKKGNRSCSRRGTTCVKSAQPGRRTNHGLAGDRRPGDLFAHRYASLPHRASGATAQAAAR